MLRECDGFFCRISVIYDVSTASTVLEQTSYVQCAYYFDRKPNDVISNV